MANIKEMRKTKSIREIAEELKISRQEVEQELSKPDVVEQPKEEKKETKKSTKKGK